MNLPAYDNIEIKVNRNKTWVNIKYKQIFSKEIHYNGYVEYKSRYNPVDETYEYYLVFQPNRSTQSAKVHIDELGRTKIPISKIWNKLNFSNKHKDFNITLEYIESIEDSDIFLIVV